ncbi:phosphopantetheine-binding protein [Streptomyces sp. NPDC091289]|uniref:phosphopantetheine-binding protein n=1 Tax=Streptomyces sp. NPDC091289 TaxID=3365989 RepID=UPI0038299B08
MNHSELADTYGTPLYVYDLDEVEAAHQELRAILPEGAALFYSLKANPHPDIARTLAAAGCRGEVSSTGELTAALESGFDPAEILYTGPGKTAGEIGLAVRSGVGTFSAESLQDLRRLGSVALAHGRRARCLLRVNGTHGGGGGLRMTGVPSQFGLPLETAADWAPEAVEVPGVDLAGFHAFAMTNAVDEEALFGETEASLAAIIEVALRHGLPVETLDLGGGFAHPYAVPGARPPYPRFRERMEAAVARLLPTGASTPVELAFESGRYLTGACGQLLTRVTDTKRSKGRTYVVLDTGVHHFGGLSGLRRLPPVAAAPVDPDGSPAGRPPGATERLTLVGPLCTPSDVLAHDAVLPLPEPGDLLAVPNVGAYGLTTGLLGFLSRPTPVEIAVHQGRLVSASSLQLRRTPATPGKGTSTMTASWPPAFENALRQSLPLLEPSEALLPDTRLAELGLDSMATVQLLVVLEEVFARMLPDELITHDTFATPADVWAFVEAAAVDGGSG